jgi:hypothetical protein
MKTSNPEIKLPPGWRKLKSWYYRRVDGADAYEYEPGKWLAEGPPGTGHTKKMKSAEKCIAWLTEEYEFNP